MPCLRLSSKTCMLQGRCLLCVALSAKVSCRVANVQQLRIVWLILNSTLVLQGAPGQALTAADMQGMEAFLSAANPRVRALGGTRFNGASQPSPEWQAFGSFCFMIPRLELLEAAGCCLLSCTLAWKPQLGPQDRSLRPLLSHEGSRHSSVPSGCHNLCLRRVELSSEPPSHNSAQGVCQCTFAAGHQLWQAKTCASCLHIVVCARGGAEHSFLIAFFQLASTLRQVRTVLCAYAGASLALMRLCRMHRLV